jgi:hypothetical protein
LINLWCRTARPVTVLCPVEPDKVEALKATLASLPHGDASPLRITGRTHFGRWVVIERLRDEDGDPTSDKLTVPYLLFTSNIDGDTASYLRDLVAGSPAAMHEVWSHCIGYQGPGDDPALVAYLLGNQIRTGLFFSPYPRATVQRVSSVVNLRRSFIEFAVGAEDLSTEALPGAFRTWYDAQAKNVRC